MTTRTPDPTPPLFDCKRRRHKVITADRICVLCGARNVIDARRLPPTPEPTAPLIDISPPTEHPSTRPSATT